MLVKKNKFFIFFEEKGIITIKQPIFYTIMFYIDGQI